MAGIKITGLGKSQGDTRITNDQLSKTVDTSDEWIRAKTGIRSRYFANQKKNEDMAYEAATEAIRRSGVPTEDIGLCIVCTFTPDDVTPAVSCKVAGRLGLKEDIMALDINGACSGFIYGCNIANGILSSGEIKAALIIGSEKISSYMDMSDRATCVLFGDGAGAAVLEYDDNGKFAFYGGCVSDRNVLYCEDRSTSIKMSGQEVYRFAVSKVPECINKVMEKADCKDNNIDFYVCHQANERIIDNVAKRIDGEDNKFYKNLYDYGNTSAASIPIALCQMQEENLLNSGMTVLCTGFGAGLTYGSMIIEFS